MSDLPKRSVGGTWIREPDGACLLFYSPYLYNDPPTALRVRKEEFRAVGYWPLPDNVFRPKDVEKLKPGEYMRIHANTGFQF
jgi:hypothetical protein